MADEKPVETVKYQLTQPHYRLGRYFQPGEFISIPIDEKPGRTWIKVDEEAEPAKAEKKAPPKGKRASDLDPAAAV